MSLILSSKQTMNFKELFNYSKRKDGWVSFDFTIVTVVLLCALLWAWHEFMSSPPYVDASRYPVRGIDISSHNGMMNLDAAAADGVEFVFIKATEGSTFRDENFRINYNKALHAGLKIGAYHFFRFDRDGVEQARNLLQAVGIRHLDLGIAVDVESMGNPHDIPVDSVVYRLSQMVDYLNLKGKRVMFYTNKEGYEKYLMNNFPGAPLWICSFNSHPIDAEWTFWQFNHHGHVRGIRGDVDLNVFMGNRDEWQNFLKGTVYPYSN